MNIYKQLEIEHSKENSHKIISYVGNDPARFDELMQCFFAGISDYRIPQRAAHVVSLTFDNHPNLIFPYLDKMIDLLMEKELMGPLKRNIVRILQFCEINKKNRARVYNRCMALLENPNEEIAVRAFSMAVLYNISQNFADLKPELKSVIEMVLDEPGASPGISSRGRKIRAKLDQDLL